jgi:hypothetical protein
MTQSTPTEIEIFNSALDSEASEKFDRWRRANKALGHYLNLNPAEGWFLHRARCPSTNMPPGSDLAANEKRCAARRETIQRYAAAEGITPKRCQQCNPL